MSRASKNDFDGLIENPNLHHDVIDKLNKDSEDMFYALKIRKRKKDFTEEKYQRLLIHHLLITHSNLASNLTDHLFYLIGELEKGDKSNENFMEEMLHMINVIDQSIYQAYPTDHYKEVEEFATELGDLGN
jgi:hypothetical protein